MGWDFLKSDGWLRSFDLPLNNLPMHLKPKTPNADEFAPNASKLRNNFARGSKCPFKGFFGTEISSLCSQPLWAGARARV